jgi:hypothetical protein
MNVAFVEICYIIIIMLIIMFEARAAGAGSTSLYSSGSTKMLRFLAAPQPVLRSRKELHHSDGARAVTRCGSGYDGSGSEICINDG